MKEQENIEASQEANEEVEQDLRVIPSSNTEQVKILFKDGSELVLTSGLFPLDKVCGLAEWCRENILQKENNKKGNPVYTG